jgi:hypothetical protein
MIGEIVHNLRSCLDNMIWQLVLDAKREPRVRVTGFPVYLDQESFERRGRQQLSGLCESAIAAIEQMQPYNHVTTESAAAHHFLAILHELWNIDKHRMVHVCVANAQVTHSSWTPAGELPLGCFARPCGPINDGDLLSVVAGRFAHEVAIATKVDLAVVLDEATGGGAPERELGRLLQGLFDRTRSCALKLYELR